MDFNYKNRGLSLNVYSEDHVGVDFHTNDHPHGNQTETRITATHFPKQTEGERRREHEEFFTLTLEKFSGDDKPNVGRASDGVHVYLDRETLERIHFAAGELLAQAEGIADNAAGARIVCSSKEDRPSPHRIIRLQETK